MPSPANEQISTAVGLARVEEMLKGLQRANEKSDESRRELYQSVNEIKLSTQSIDHRVQNLEREFAEASPTLKEFTAIKNQVQGAGKLGKFLWWIGGFIMATATWFVTHLYGSK